MNRRKYINQVDIAYPGCLECILQFQAFKCACEGHTPMCLRFERRQNIHNQTEKALLALSQRKVSAA